ncbi:MAG: Arc family DNA-binding protein [Clostridiales bacterium]|nr:Arc family DNA-binding protein [Clostridiales bacterium]
MPNEKKSTYKGQTDARRKASAKYLKESVEDVRIRVPKGQKTVIKEHAEQQGESMNAFVIRAITQTMQQDSIQSNQ